MGSSSLQVSTDSINGLKFGKKIYTKHPPRCQVEGCSVDLSGAKAYYGRHKVCGLHSKAPMVIVGGLEQRFCQQCSRFHQLAEFDQGKRSCRRRLAGHNERRRKPPPAALSSRIGLPSSPFSVDNSSRLRGFLLNFTYPHLSERDLRTDSNCVLSLLSAQPRGSGLTGNRTPIVTAATTTTIAPMSVSSNNSFDSWGFKAPEAVEQTWLPSELKLVFDRKRQCMEFDDMGIDRTL